MTTPIIGLILTGIGLLITITGAGLAFIVRAVNKWTRVEDRLDMVVTKVTDLVADKDRVHKEIVAQMAEDRKATNDRLTWLERNLWHNRQG